MTTITKIVINGTTYNIGGSGGPADLTELTKKVDNAQATANTAHSMATNALNQSNTAITLAGQVNTKAANAQTTADEALALANEVKAALDSMPQAEGSEF